MSSPTVTQETRVYALLLQCVYARNRGDWKKLLYYQNFSWRVLHLVMLQTLNEKRLWIKLRLPRNPLISEEITYLWELFKIRTGSPLLFPFKMKPLCLYPGLFSFLLRNFRAMFPTYRLSRQIRSAFLLLVVVFTSDVSHSFIHSFIHQWPYSPLLVPGFSFSFVIFFTQTVGLLGRMISPSQGPYLHTGQHKHRINAYTDIHALNGIRTHEPSVRDTEDSSCLSTRGHRDRSICIQRQCNYILNYEINRVIEFPLWNKEKYEIVNGNVGLSEIFRMPRFIGRFKCCNEVHCSSVYEVHKMTALYLSVRKLLLSKHCRKFTEI
jgi:hypothetical protein